MSATISTDKFAAYLGNALKPPSSLTCFNNDVSHGKSYSAPNSHYTEAEYGIQSTHTKHPTHTYPTSTSTSKLAAAPVMFIPGFTYPVSEYYKNDFEEALRGNIDLNAWRNQDPGSVDGGQKPDPLGARIGGQKRPGDIDYDLLVRLIIKLSIGENGKYKKYGNEKESNTKNNNAGDGGWDDVRELKEESVQGNRVDMFVRAEGSILIFLPGVPEINKTIRLLESVWGDIDLPPNSPKLKIIPL